VPAEHFNTFLSAQCQRLASDKPCQASFSIKPNTTIQTRLTLGLTHYTFPTAFEPVRLHLYILQKTPHICSEIHGIKPKVAGDND